MPHRHGFRSILCLSVTGLTVCLSSAFAQIGIALRADHTRFLRFEPIELVIVLRNYSGNTLVFGSGDRKESGYIDFIVDSHTETPVPKLDRHANPAENLILGAGETRELSLAVNRIFNMQRDGSYTIKARVGHPRLSHDYESNSVTVDVQEGLPVVSRIVGMPTAKASEPIRSVTVSLWLFEDENGSLYCLRAEDEKYVYGTIRLGPEIAGGTPELDADAASDIHVLFQTRPRLYSYSVFSIVGYSLKQRVQRYYVSENGAPHLSRMPGCLKVVGGRLAVEGVDYRMGNTSSTGG